ncbi:MAG: hypothetical protein L3J95_02320 [Thermoplasmata archaeon]|nr:hypothetical protein [Thermoplasmata archaeon]MCI4359242.1 hypothetical protein [Thermoplasmata archaeon]
MATPGGTPGPGAPSPTMHRESRWLGQGYADITKLREVAAKHDRQSSRAQQRAARIQTRIERLRHGATILREKSQQVLEKVPEVQQEITQLERDIQTGRQRAVGIALSSDITSLQVRMRKLQQKIINLQHKSRTLEHRAAQRTQKSAELKVKVDRLLEISRLEEQEASSFRQRADRLQLATEGEVSARVGPSAPPNEPSRPPGPA